MTTNEQVSAQEHEGAIVLAAFRELLSVARKRANEGGDTELCQLLDRHARALDSFDWCKSLVVHHGETAVSPDAVRTALRLRRITIVLRDQVHAAVLTNEDGQEVASEIHAMMSDLHMALANIAQHRLTRARCQATTTPAPQLDAENVQT